MKRRYFISLFVGGLAFLALASSCDNYDDQPSQNKTSYTRTYKLPDPTNLSDEERATVDGIRAEYNSATANQ